MIQPRWITNRRLYLLFLFVAAVLFAPFLIQGRVLFGNTDNIWGFYPNIIFGHNSFRSGDFGLWNPYLFAGADSSTMMHHHILNPVNWSLLLAPNSLVLEAITAKVLVEISLIGFFASLAAMHLLRDRMSAVACGLAFQLSGFTWFTTTNSFTTDMLLAMTIYIYILVTYERRAAFWNYSSMTICFAILMFGGDLAYCIAFLIPAPVLALIIGREMSGWGRVRLLGTLVVSGATALALAGFRIITLALKVGETSRLAAFMHSPPLDSVPGNNGALLLPGLIPGIWGLNFSDGATMFHWLKLDNTNLQFHALAHFAVLPLMLIFLGMSGRLGRPAFIASAAAAIFAVTDNGFIPVSYELVYAVFRPIHPIAFKVSCALLGAAAVVFACRHLEEDDSNADLTRIPLAASFIIGAACLAMWLKCIYNVPLQALEPYRPLLEKLLRLLTAGAFFGAMGTLLFGKRLRLHLLSKAIVSAYLLGAVAIAIFYYRCNLFTTSLLTIQSLVYTTAAVVCGALTITALRRWRVQDGEASAWRSLVPVFAISVLAVSFPLPEYPGPRTESVIFASAMLSIGRFLVLAVLGVELLSFVQRIGWRPILPFILVFLFADAILLERGYENFGTKGFERPAKIYISNTSVSADGLNAPAGPNLVQNEPLQLASPGVAKWSLGGIGPQAQADTLEPNAAIIRGGSDSTLFQDVRLPPETHQFVFGAWVKSRDPRVMIMLTAKVAGGEPIGAQIHHSGSGQWEWLSVSLNSNDSIWEARPHLFVGTSEGEILGPVLATGNRAEPRRQPKDVSGAAVAEASARSEKRDFSQFRVNFPQTRLGFPGEPFSNIPMLYGFRCYGGEDSVMDPELERLLTAFVPDPTLVATFGVRNAITEPRILDLLGVRYDLRSDKVRPNALPRVSIFSNSEVAPDFDAQVARLKDSSFNYTTTVLVNHAPSGEDIVSDAKERFVPTPYTQVSNSHVHVKTSVSRAAVLLFNDSFSTDWCAYRNGLRIPILRANGHFMAVSLPAGMSEIDFRFEPTRFYLLFKISISTALLLLLAGIWRLSQDKWRKRIPE